MRKSIEAVIDEMKGKMSGYAVLLYYRYSNLCVKAEPVSLLSITVTDLEGQEQNLEDVAYAMMPNDYQLEIVPGDPQMFFNVCKGLKEAHPEFKQEIIVATDENRIDPHNEEERHLICKMPEVNDDRYDALMDSAKVLYDGCKTQMDATNEKYKVILATKLVGLTEEQVQEAHDAFDEVGSKHMEMIDQYHADKVKEIEDAHHKWLSEQTDKATREQEIAAARGTDKGYVLDMNDEDNQ